MLGLVREQVLASFFGAGNEMDAFIVAFRIPNLARDLFAEGAMSAAFVPTFTRHLAAARQGRRLAPGQQRDQRARAGDRLLVVLGLIFAGPLVSAYAGDYAAVPGKLELTIALTRIMLPFLTLVAVAAVVMGMLNSLHHYFVPALAPAMFNVATIVCAFALVPVMPAARAAADHGDRHRARSSAGSGRWRSSGRRSGAKDSATGRCSISRIPVSGGCCC